MTSSRQFCFSPGETTPGHIYVSDTAVYDAAVGYGFAAAGKLSKDENGHDSLPGDYDARPTASFVVDVPVGNYVVAVKLGGSSAPSATTVKFGPGRIALDNVQTRPGECAVESFAVHVDDGKLKLAFLGSAPRVAALEIRRAADAPTLFIAGDSTVTDQPSGQFPYAGWGQMISLYLNSRVAVANHARSGRSSKSFIAEGRLEQIWSRIRPGDFLFVQFAHNDEKSDERGTAPFTSYKEHLRRYIAGARERGAHPVLVTPMHRRFFDDAGRITDTHGDYIAAMRQLSVEENAPLLDLAAESRLLFDRLGEAGTKRLFMWAEPGEFPNFPEGVCDNTHFCERGAIEIARLVAKGIAEKLIQPLSSCLTGRF